MSDSRLQQPALQGAGTFHERNEMASTDTATDPDISTDGRYPALSLRLNFSWTLLGNLAFAGSRWFTVLVIAKLCPVEALGQYSLALAVVAPMVMLLRLQLRAVLITDSRGEYQFGHYRALQMLLSLVGLTGLVVWALVGDFEPVLAMLIVLIAVLESLMSVRDIYLGLMHKLERMDIIGRSQIIRSCGALVAFASVLWYSRVLLDAVMALLVVLLAVWAIYDVPMTRRLAAARYGPSIVKGFVVLRREPRRLAKLTWTASPLGIIMMFIALNQGLPRYVLGHYHGESTLGYFQAVASLMVAGSMVAGALGGAAAPRLAKYFVSNRAAYVALLRKLMLIGAAMGVAGVVLAYVWGGTMLRLVATEEYSAYARELTLGMVAAGLSYGVSFLGYAVTAARRFMIQVPVFATGCVASFAVGVLVVPSYDVMGGVAMVLAGNLAIVLLLAAVCVYTVRRAGEGAGDATQVAGSGAVGPEAAHGGDDG